MNFEFFYFYIFVNLKERQTENKTEPNKSPATWLNLPFFFNSQIKHFPCFLAIWISLGNFLPLEFAYFILMASDFSQVQIVISAVFLLCFVVGLWFCLFGIQKFSYLLVHTKIYFNSIFRSCGFIVLSSIKSKSIFRAKMLDVIMLS